MHSDSLAEQAAQRLGENLHNSLPQLRFSVQPHVRDDDADIRIIISVISESTECDAMRLDALIKQEVEALKGEFGKRCNSIAANVIVCPRAQIDLFVAPLNSELGVFCTDPDLYRLCTRTDDSIDCTRQRQASGDDSDESNEPHWPAVASIDTKGADIRPFVALEALEGAASDEQEVDDDKREPQHVSRSAESRLPDAAAEPSVDKLRLSLLRADVLVVGVSGKIGSGKTTLCDALRSHYGSERCTVRNFADLLKEQVAQHYGFPVEWCYSTSGKQRRIERCQNKTIGEILQDWGTALRDGVDANVWVEGVHTWLQSRLEQVQQYNDAYAPLHGIRLEHSASGSLCTFAHIVLLGDVRFPNEYRFVRETCGGVVVRLEGDPCAVRARSRRDLMHISETALDDPVAFPRDLVIDTQALDGEQSAALAIDFVQKRHCSTSTRRQIARAHMLHKQIVPLLQAIRNSRALNEGLPMSAPEIEYSALWSAAFEHDLEDEEQDALVSFEAIHWLRLQQKCIDYARNEPLEPLPSIQALIDSCTRPLSE